MNNTAFVTLSHELKYKDVFEGCKSVKFFDGLTPSLKKSKSDFVLILSLDEVMQLEKLKKDLSLISRLKGLLIKDDKENKNIFSSMMESLKLKTFLNRTIDFSSNQELKRIVQAWNMGAQKDLISSFEVISEEMLYLKTCDFNKIFVPVKSLKSLSELTKDELTNFVLNEDGSYVHWPDKDIHLDLENFRDAVDPNSKIKAKIKNLKYDKNYGRALKLVREELGLNQNELGLSDKQVRRYELGQSRPSYKSYQIISETIGLDLKDYLNRVAEAYQRLIS